MKKKIKDKKGKTTQDFDESICRAIYKAAEEGMPIVGATALMTTTIAQMLFTYYRDPEKVRDIMTECTNVSLEMIQDRLCSPGDFSDRLMKHL